MSDPQRPDRNLAMELARVTEAAALAAGRWIGHGDKIAADQAAVDAMRLMIDTVSMHGTVVIGEGEKDEAPMLYNGERWATANGPASTWRSTRSTEPPSPPSASRTRSRSSRCSRATRCSSPDAAVYMEKIAAGPEAADVIDITASPEENVRPVAKAKGVRPEESAVTVLDRPRHEDLIAASAASALACYLISDGDVAGAIAAAARAVGHRPAHGDRRHARRGDRRRRTEVPRRRRSRDACSHATTRSGGRSSTTATTSTPC